MEIGIKEILIISFLGYIFYTFYKDYKRRNFDVTKIHPASL